jgi:NADH-quinone oxidoreductase subunit J
MHGVLFYVLAALTVVGAVGVVVSRDIVRAAVQLLFALLGVAGLYFLLSAEFLAAVQLVIYVGGTLILLIFGVMLTARAGTHSRGATWSERIVAFAAAVVLGVAMTATLVAARFETNPLPPGEATIQNLGHALLGTYLLPFELSSVLLLAVMLGAAYLARRHGREKGAA